MKANLDKRDTLLACEVCLKEIPASGAMSDEAKDYVSHFCGLECYEIWKAGQQEKKRLQPTED